MGLRLTLDLNSVTEADIKDVLAILYTRHTETFEAFMRDVCVEGADDDEMTPEQAFTPAPVQQPVAPPPPPVQHVTAPPPPVDVDAAGVAWNPALHAGNKAKKANGTWKARKGLGGTAPAQQQVTAPPPPPVAAPVPQVAPTTAPTGLPPPVAGPSWADVMVLVTKAFTELNNPTILAKAASVGHNAAEAMNDPGKRAALYQWLRAELGG